MVAKVKRLACTANSADADGMNESAPPGAFSPHPESERESGMSLPPSLLDLARGQGEAHLLWQLSLMRRVRTDHGVGGSGKQIPYWGIEDLVMREGFVVPWSPLPVGIRPKRLGECFRNAYELAISCGGERFVYMEGMALSVIGMHHAWVLDLETGQIVDDTWTGDFAPESPDATGYIGVAFSLEYLCRILERTQRWGGVIFAYEINCPLFQVPGELARAQEGIHPQAFDLLRSMGYQVGAARDDVVAELTQRAQAERLRLDSESDVQNGK